MARFRGVDYYQIDELLSDEERMIRDTMREFVEEQVVPVIERHFREGTFPRHLIPELGKLGVLGSNLEGYGCAGLNNIAYGLIMQELERGDTGIRSFVSVQTSLAMYPIHAFGSDEQKAYWLPKMAAGEKIGCFGLTEPDHGSDPAGMTTRAVRDGNGYVLNGAKMWITNGSMADIAVVWAKAEDGQIGGFLVEKGTPGFEAPEMKGKHSLRASVTSELVFQDCRIPAENRLPRVEGLKSTLTTLTQARYGIAWGAVGAAMACYETALEYAKSRIQFGKPIAGFQLVQRKLVWMLTEITKAQLLCWRLGRLKDEGRARHTLFSMAKMNNVQMALDCARLARDILAANGILDEYPVMRHMCNLES
ncbi:MAG: acyl-CoA dehydrogenase family protein, partial [Deltaproteobacteria bacterium]|nr:acyl-CoA dehydrogenase family protein [Deltaproteobacteria bacterium]